ncbi:MAG: DNA polymerase I [Chloroflexi bacterium]|nr:DNA polymerase I [Chloroflexota bacterium]
MFHEKPLLLLIDTNALVHRAYHALPRLTVGKTGEVVNAVYGFASMLLKVLHDLQPTYVIAAFDMAAPTFRHREYRDYKAQRPKMAEELGPQFARVRQLLDGFGIPIYEMEGYEADDVLGTLAHQASEKEVDTVIVTGDTDALQLVAPRVRMLTSRRNFGDVVVYDEGSVRQRYGLEPIQLVDLKGLRGDASDNIPGVPGIGDKTATKLIQQFGGLEGIYGHIQEVEPAKLRQLLQANEDIARQSKRLATIVTDIPITLDLDACHVRGYQRERALELFRELEFVSLLPKLSIAEEAPTPTLPTARVEAAAPQGDYRIVNTVEALDEMLAELGPPPQAGLVVDVETTHKEAMRARLVGISLSTCPGQAFYVPVGHGESLPLPLVRDRLRPVLEDEDIPKVAHNGAYDMIVLAEHGIRLRGLAFDTMIAAHLLGEKALGLKSLAFTRLGVEMKPITALIGTGSKQITMAEVPVAAVADYACADADMTCRLKSLLETELREQGLWPLFTDLEMPLVPVLATMERNGVALDITVLRDMSQELYRQMGDLERKVYEMVGHQFNINSSQQLSTVLFTELRLPRARKTKGGSGYSTDASVLEGLRGVHPAIEPLLEYRQLAKLKSTYVDALPALINPKTGRLHSSFNQTGTATGRVSSSEPNLQNIPIRTELGRQVRRAFVGQGNGDPCWLLAADYSQIDLRVLAHLSQDAGLLAAFMNDEDIHAATASQVFAVPQSQVTPDMRRIAKTVNFGVIYGMSEYGLAQSTELSRQEASQFISAYFEKYPGIREYMAATKERVRRLGYVQTLLGRRRYIPDVNAADANLRAAAERMAINMPVQGTSSEVIKRAMIRLNQRMGQGMKSRLILQVHDELIFEVPPEEVEAMRQLVTEVMPNAMSLAVPLKIEVKMGRHWGEME